MSTASAGPESTTDSLEQAGATYRYGIVFLLVFCVVAVLIVTPDGAASRAASFALISATLIIAVSTSRAPSAVRRRRFFIGTAVMVVLTILIGTDVLDRRVTVLLGALLSLAVPFTLARGLLRLVREKGVTIQAVSGALSIYLLVGLAFASLVGFVAAVGHGYYFAQGTDGSTSQHAYYSFTVMTTTGFGDLTAASRLGRALAVIEMLLGQIYLVTVIGVLIGRRSSGPPQSTRAAAAVPPGPVGPS